MKDDNIKKLNNELKFLTDAERQKEIANYNTALESNNADIKAIAKEIYLRRGIDYAKLNKGLFNNIINTITDLSTIFKNKDSKVKRKMIVEIIYIVLVLLLLKIPFDLVRDVGYDYIDLLSTNNTYYVLWNVLFLVLYTITIFCTFIVLIRNFNNKYKNIN